MTHPLQAIPSGWPRWVALLLLSIGTLLLANEMRAVLSGVQPNVVALELAATPDRATEILHDWGPVGVAAVQNHLRLDNLWLILYSTTLALLCVMAADSVQIRLPVLAKVGIGLAWGQWLAGGLDRLENFALEKTLIAGPTSTLTMVASSAAALKFLLVLAAAVYLLTVLAARLAPPLSPGASRTT